MVRKQRMPLLLVTVVMWAIIIYPSHAFSFAGSSHRIINEAAAFDSQIDPYLRDLLGFSAGLKTPLENSRGVTKSAVGWISEGGAAEDRWLFKNWLGETFGVTRSSRHYHQPLRDPWVFAGLWWGLWQCSAHWAQNPIQAPGRNASWFDARSTYLYALTAPTEEQRNELFAETFQSIGQIMHLVADKATALHTRDDVHVFCYNFETFVANPINKDLISGFIGFDSSILGQPSPDNYAHVPIARLWDTNTYNGTNPPGDSDQQIGLAEFSNANFFSEGTIRKTAFADSDFPLPATDRLVPGPRVLDWRTQEYRQYLSKPGDGVPVEHMVLAGVFEAYDSEHNSDNYQLDDVVYKDYAQYLLPRAIGYCAGIPDYFFRGKIKIESPDRFVYALARYDEGNTGSFTKMRFKVSNDTDYPNTSEDTVGLGQMWAVVRYRKPLSGNLFEDPFVSLSNPFYAVSEPQDVDLSRDPLEVTFNFTDTNSIPTNAADIFLAAVWFGQLGEELGAVMVGVKDLFEPHPLTFGNCTDYDCYKQTLYHVADLDAFPPYNPPDQTQRDVDVPKDDIQDIFGPWTELDQYIKTYDLSNPQTASSSLYDFYVAQHLATVDSPEYSRFVLLQDQSEYAFSWRINKSIYVPTGDPNETDRFYDFSVYGILNDFVVVNPDTGQTKRRVTPNFEYRGVQTFCIYIMVVGGAEKFAPCLSDSYSLPEPLTRVEGDLAPE